MILFDAINASFEVGGGILTWQNVRVLWRHREVKGVYWPATALFAIWGLWNCIWYPHLGQWLSFFGGIFIFTANATWVGMVLRFKR